MRTKDGLAKSKYSKMTDIQRASLPHSFCGHDIFGAARTGSEKTLAFITPAATRALKKKLKINVHRPVGTRFGFDEEGNTLPPLAKFSGRKSSIIPFS